MKYAIRVPETRGKTVIVDANTVDEAMNIVKDNIENIDLKDEDFDYEISSSEFSNSNGTATDEQIEYCEHLECD